MTAAAGVRESPGGRRAQVARHAHRVLAPVVDRGTWAGTAVLLLGAVPSAVVMGLVLVGLVAGAALVPVGIGLALVVAALTLVRAAADVDRRVLVAVLDLGDALDVDAPGASGEAGWVARVRALLGDARTWRSLAWLAVRSGAGLIALLGLVVVAVVALALLAVPFVDGYLAVGTTWRSASGWTSAWTLLVAGLLLVGVAHGLAALVVAHVRLAVLLLGPDPAERVLALQRAVETSDERRRLAHDLHDGLGYALTLVVVQAEAATTALDGDPAAVRPHLEAVASAARGALDDLDAALGRLEGSGSLAPTLADLPVLLRSARDAGLDVHLAGVNLAGSYPLAVADPSAVHPAPDVSAAAYRVVQEGLSNALRHSDSRSVTVRVEPTALDLRVVVVTPGPRRRRPLLGVRASGRGMPGLDERVRRTGGRLTAGEREGDHVLEAVWPRP